MRDNIYSKYLKLLFLNIKTNNIIEKMQAKVILILYMSILSTIL